MKIFLSAMLILLLPALTFANGICKSLGGVCKKSCDQSETQERGTFVDCDKYYCCTPEVSSSLPQEKSSKGTVPAPSVSKPAPASSKASSAEGASDRETAGSLSPDPGKILVCHPVKDTYALPDTALRCGNMDTTLRELYEDDFRLLQIIQDKKTTLYYLDKR